MLAQSIGLFFWGNFSFLAWFISEKIWDSKTAIKVGWIVALFPSLILYSVLTLREVYQGFFLLVAFIGIFYWVKHDSKKHVLLATASFIGAAFFHGALILGGVFFLLIVFLINIKKLFNSIMNSRLNITAF